MGMKKKTSPTSGDVFTIPVTKERCAIGVVVVANIDLYLCVYKELFAGANAKDASLSLLTPALIARTTDEYFHSGEWKVISNVDLPFEFPKPCYVVRTNEGLVLKNFHGSKVREATNEDLLYYGGARWVSNITFLKALRSMHGLDEGSYDYERIKYSHVKERVC